ncbi:unnamed protein product [Diamesa serratosioi]
MGCGMSTSSTTSGSSPHSGQFQRQTNPTETMIEAYHRLDDEILSIENSSPGARLTTAEAWVEHLETMHLSVDDNVSVLINDSSDSVNDDLDESVLVDTKKGISAVSREKSDIVKLAVKLKVATDVKKASDQEEFLARISRGLMQAETDKLKNDMLELYELDTQIRDSTLTVLNEIKMNEINKIIIQIGTSTENVGQVIHSYSGNKTFMINYLVEYIRFLQLENLESSLVEFLDIKVTGTTSLVDIFIEKSKKYQLENTNTLRTSTNKIVHDFFFVMLINIEKGHSLLDLCYKLKAHYLGDCLGTLHYCYDVLGMFETGTMVRSKDPSRIWERYSLGNTWYGRHGMALAGERRVMLNSFKTFNYCDQCRCTCDQSVHRNAVRSFYIGKVRPLRSEYVITGVRFSEHNKTIYLEIQVGQLLPMGFIKPSTIHWEGPPIDININVVRYDFNFRMFYLDFIKVKTGFLSGFEFYRTNDTFRLRTYSKKFTNFTIGTVSDKEEIQVDNDVYKIFKLQDRIPNMLKTKGKIDTKYNKTIMFGPSNQEADAGQSMVPYFDATDITFDLKAPLGGIGLFHHTSDSAYAGYVRPFVSSLNYSDIIEF